MITYTILVLIFVILGFYCFNRKYKTINIFSEDPKDYTVLMIFAIIYEFIIGIYLILKYFP